MKLRFILILLFTLFVSPTLHAGGGGAAVLDDKQLASVRGGFCLLEVCEDPPGTGVCQTIPPNTLCDLTRCVFSNEIEGNVEVYQCLFAGEYTCSSTASYRQCVLHFSLSACSYGNDLQCGTIEEPSCAPDKVDRTCVCAVETLATPCDWTDCVQNF